MAIHDIWLDNLTRLVMQEGNGIQRPGLRAVSAMSGVSEEYIYQLITRKTNKDGSQKQFGKALARKIDTAYAKERGEGWFDKPFHEKDAVEEDGSAENAPTKISQSIHHIVEALRRATHPERAAVKSLLPNLIDDPENSVIESLLCNVLRGAPPNHAFNLETRIIANVFQGMWDSLKTDQDRLKLKNAVELCIAETTMALNSSHTEIKSSYKKTIRHV